MKSFADLSIQQKLATMILVVTVTVISIATAIAISFSSKASKQEFQQRTTRIAMLQAEALIEPLWQFDAQAGTNVLKMASDFEHFLFAAVKDDAHATFITYGNSENIDRDSAVEVRKEIFRNDERIGEVAFYFDNSFLKEQLHQIVFNAVVAGAILLSILYLTIVVPLRFVITPLTQMVDAMKLLAIGATDVDTPSYAFNDEISDIGDALEFFRYNNTARHSMILNTVSEGIFEIDLEGKVVFVNPAALQMLGYTEEDKLSEEIDFDVFQIACSNAITPIEEARETGVSVTIDNADFQTKNGTSFHVEYTVSPVKDSEGFISGAVIIFRNISARKVAEEQLYLAKKAAEESVQQKSMFLANMSHEIRTPMNGVLGMLSLLLDTSLGKDQKDLAQTAMDSGEALLEIINDILDFSKIESGKMELSPHNFSLSDTLSQIEKLMSFKAEQTGIELVVNVDPQVPDQLFGDSHRLRQIIINLLGNSMKFTEKEGVVVFYISLGRETSHEVEITFQVTDTGIGIPDERQNAIFDAFSQADSSTTRKFGGTGLGLSICSKLVELLGGEIDLSSIEGKGTTFFFSIPFGRGEALEVLPQTPRSGKTSAAARPLRILLAEDNLVNQKLASKILEKAGHSVVIANNGKEAVETFRESRFDLVLMDMQMPVMGGREAAAIIKQTEIGSQVPIVALTANAMAGDRERYLKEGLDGYVSKPINTKELFVTIEALTL
jgi:PAS domain S-box-containing protein